MTSDDSFTVNTNHFILISQGRTRYDNCIQHCNWVVCLVPIPFKCIIAIDLFKTHTEI